jgi:hypothetical protein
VPIGFRIASLPGINRAVEWLLPRGVVEASVREVYGDPSKVTPRWSTATSSSRCAKATARAGAALPGAGDSTAGGRANVCAHPRLQMPTLLIWGARDG